VLPLTHHLKLLLQQLRRAAGSHSAGTLARAPLVALLLVLLQARSN
jgi:hypothetical protein